jgi:cytochrome c551/c552
VKIFLQASVALLLLAALSYGGLRWLGDGAVSGGQDLSPMQQAQRLVEARGCPACHSLDGKAGIGPSWLGSWGAQRQFVGGGSSVVDAAYLREAMLEPAARVVQGFDNIMLPTGFTDAEVGLVTQFIRELAVAQKGDG